MALILSPKAQNKTKSEINAGSRREVCKSNEGVSISISHQYTTEVLQGDSCDVSNRRNLICIKCLISKLKVWDCACTGTFEGNSM
jgi:hypothetical protein